MRSTSVAAVLLTALSLLPDVRAQSWDSSGNSMLQGTYSFRQVIWVVADNSVNLGRALTLYGTISFDGNGKYNLSSGQLMDSNAGSPRSYTTTGTYSISSSGYGFISHPYVGRVSLFGLVSKGIFVGSSTESDFNDLFVAAAQPSSALANSTLQGNYSMVGMDFPTGSPYDTRDSQFQVTADGNGGIGNVQATGYIGANGSTLITQNFSGIRYAAASGALNIAFGGSLNANNLLAGTKAFYVSSDGDFIFGGSLNGYDMIVGVRSRSTPQYGGLYYQAGVYQDLSQLANNGFADLNTFYGAFKANSGTLLSHERLFSVFRDEPLDYTFSDAYTTKSATSYEDSSASYYVGGGGNVRVGFGKAPLLGINVAVQAPAFTPSGVFIDPTGLTNAANSSLFTSGIAPGELITLYGTNLSSATQADSSFPTTLAGVQIQINNRPAPIYSVSPNQVSAVVPFGTTESIAAIQLTSNGTQSNALTTYVNKTAPGVFTIPPGGIGYAAALHTNFSVVTASSPAQPGETVSLFLTGLGSVNPPVADAAPGPAFPLSVAVNSFSVYINGQKAALSYAGLAPQLVGLYQINMQVPGGTTSGDATVDVQGPDSYTSQALLPVGQSTGMTQAPVVRRLAVPAGGTGSPSGKLRDNKASGR